ncbi:MAG: trypsin-like serine protease, partial [Bacteriovoracaceae bacterium]|nr:trypsin-like serine protease [Bacteriovoracaceae bacterium]
TTFRRISMETLELLPKVAKIIIHPNFISIETYPTKQVDLALIELTNDIEFNEGIRPIQLPDMGDKIEHIIQDDNSNFVASGWGLTANIPTEEEPDELQAITLSGFYFLSEVPEKRRYLALKPKNRQSLCLGDSGGPLALIEENVLVGVISFFEDEHAILGLKPNCNSSYTTAYFFNNALISGEWRR